MFRSRQKQRESTFDPNDKAKVKHSVVGGVWDLYEEINTDVPLANVPGSARLESVYDMLNCLPSVWRMVKDISSIPGCRFLLGLYLFVGAVLSLVPALELWFSGQLLKIVQTAIDDQILNKNLLIQVAVGRTAYVVTSRLLRYSRLRLSIPLEARIKNFYSAHMFHATARLDLPTFDDPMVQRQLEQASSKNGTSSIAWQTVTTLTMAASSTLQLVSQVVVLLGALKTQRNVPLLALISAVEAFFGWNQIGAIVFRARVWAATTRHPEFIKAQGMKKLIAESAHRKEIVAGGMWEYLVAEYNELLRKIPPNAGEFKDNKTDILARYPFTILIKEPLNQILYLMLTLQALERPSTIAISIASLNLVREASDSFTLSLFNLINQSSSVSEQLSTVRKLYQVGSIPNKVIDVGEDSSQETARPFLESWGDVLNGVEVEFRNVSFKYPGSDALALNNVSFRIQKGQLCVIVGANGSGKSTILKLLMRLYDPTDGNILFNGEDIKLLKLKDLRRSISVLFQDYTDFPLSLKDNIALGDPSPSPPTLPLIQEAARLGGADGFISRLPEGYDTYLRRPVDDCYSDLPEGTKSLFGRDVDYGGVKEAGGMGVSGGGAGVKGVSGGELQRLALSRTFMRSLASVPMVGMLLFDEPSASLDPTAEHDLFERLRHLRGSKTMIFSSHRFGNLTRHADIILYMNDSLVVEEGTHNELVKKGGEYARIWSLQAEAFL